MPVIHAGLSFRGTPSQFLHGAQTALLKSMGNRCLSRPARVRGFILTLYTSCDVFRHKKVPCLGLFDTVPHM